MACVGTRRAPSGRRRHGRGTSDPRSAETCRCRYRARERRRSVCDCGSSATTKSRSSRKCGLSRSTLRLSRACSNTCNGRQTGTNDAADAAARAAFPRRAHHAPSSASSAASGDDEQAELAASLDALAARPRPHVQPALHRVHGAGRRPHELAREDAAGASARNMTRRRKAVNESCGKRRRLLRVPAHPSRGVRQQGRPGATRPRDGGRDLDTYSHLWPDSDDRTREAVDAVFGSAWRTPCGLSTFLHSIVAGQERWVRMSQSIRRVLSSRAVARTARVAAIPLRRTLPHASSGLPGSSGEQPSNAPCLTLLRVGFT